MIQRKFCYVLCICIGFLLRIILLLHNSSNREQLLLKSVSKFGDLMNKDTLSEDNINNYARKISFDDFDDRIIQLQKTKKQMGQDLFEKVKILCWVMNNPTRKNYREAIMDTWGRRCNLILFVIGNESSEATEDNTTVIKLGPNAQLVEFQIPDLYNVLWLKTVTAFKYITKTYKDEYDWIYKMDDDTFIIMENLRLFLKDKTLTDKRYYGCQYKTRAPKGYASGGPGYIMSSFIANRLVESFSMAGCPAGNSEKTDPEDVNVAICLSLIQIYPADTRDTQGRFRFSPFVPEMVINQALLPSEYDWWYSFRSHTMKEGFECCSDTAIAYHYVTPSFMRAMEYLIYYVHPFSTRDAS